VLLVRERIRQGRGSTPSAAILDSQSVKTTEPGTARLRWRQEGQRPQASPAGRHPGAAAGCPRDPGPIPAIATALPSCCDAQTDGTCRDCGMAGWTAAALAAAKGGAAGGAAVRGRSAKVDGGAVACMAGPASPAEQGLRVPAGDPGGGHPAGHKWPICSGKSSSATAGPGCSDHVGVPRCPRLLRQLAGGLLV
jgi:hypothetical protein